MISIESLLFIFEASIIFEAAEAVSKISSRLKPNHDQYSSTELIIGQFYKLM